MRYRVCLHTGPAEEPITLSEAKTHLRITTSDDDTYITNLITSSRQAIENYCEISMVTQTLEMLFNDFGKTCSNWKNGIQDYPRLNSEYNSIYIPKPPLQSVSSIKVFADDDTSITVDSDIYHVFTYGPVITPTKGRIALKHGQTWPYVGRSVEGVRIKFIAGYGGASDVPEQLKQCIKEELAYRYENRGECNDSLINSPALQVLAKQYKEYEL